MEKIPELKDDLFWTLINVANQEFDAFTKMLEKLSKEDLIGFAWKFEYLAGLLYDEKYHHHKYSEDYLEDLTSGVVAKGKVFFENVFNHPDQMPEKVNYDELGLDVHFQAEKVYADRFGQDMPPFDGG
jgi:hypothetical protein